MILKRHQNFLFLVMCISLATMSFTGCSKSKNAVNGEKEVQAAEGAPAWVVSRPGSSAYYIGIGNCNKKLQPLDYQAIAKKNAFNDLASEISVRVQGQTFLNTLEVNKNFSEEFISTISTTTDEKIEDFEIVGTWENDKEYWTYYRLSKSDYQHRKQEKKNMALNSANDYYLKGKSAEENANITAAFDLYMHGLFSMKEYWDEVNEYNSGTEKIFLDNEIYSSLQRITTGMRVTTGIQKIVLSAENKFVTEVPVTVEYVYKPVRGITLDYNYQRNRYMKPRTGKTDEFGKLSANVSEVSTTEKSNTLEVSINLEPLLASDLDKTVQLGLIKGMRTESLSVPIELKTPSFYIQGTEKMFGKPASGTMLINTMTSEIVNNGMRLSGSAQETNYVVTITANTTDGGSSQGFSVAYLDMTISVKNAVSGEIVYEESVGSIKGLQLNPEAASLEAYKKGREKISLEVIKSLLEVIM